MEVTNLQLFSSLFLLILAFLFYLSTTRHPKYKLPPSPPNSLPIIGHLHLIKRTIPSHRTLHNFSRKYGPIFSLRYGVRRVVVVSSSSLAQECFTKNDIVLANRPQLLISKHFNYNYTTMIHSPYGDHWRNLRRIGSLEIFSNHRLNMFLPYRRDEVKRLIIQLSRDNESQDFKQVELRPAFQELAFNVIMRMVSGNRFYSDNLSSINEQREIRKLLKEATDGGASNPGDFVPILNWVSGLEKKMVKVAKRFDCFLQGLVDERKTKSKSKGSENAENSMIDHLLSFQETQPEYYTDEIIKGLVSVMLFAGTDTSSVTLEWAMSNLLNNPSVLQKAKDELDKNVGDKCLLDEEALSKLPYLQCIISETLRLHPAAPLLVPHRASHDCKVGGYDIPSDTMVIVNAWDIHRDPTLWDDPTSFKPERFEKGNEDADHYKLIPFGMGRRACPGAGLAQRVVGLTIGSLIQCFEWKRISDEEVDMSEDVSSLMVKVQPLVAKCKPRPITKSVF